MSSTYADLQAKVRNAISDHSNATFSVQTVKDMIQAAWAEISRVAPHRFQEDITPVATTLAYQLQSDAFDGIAVDEIEVQRVEVWDTTTTPARAWRRITPQAEHPIGLSYSEVGWIFWGGLLELPNRVLDMIDPTKHIIRVWGYSPWPPVSADADAVALGQTLEEALVIYCHVEALRRLTSNRTLFTQWQTRSNNTDVSVASLLSDLANAQNEWNRRSRAIWVMREAP